MKGALRVAALLFGALPIQRGLLWIGAALVALGYVFVAPAGLVFAVLGIVLALLPTLFTSGLLLRYFVAPRSLRLIPHAREQVLGGMVLFTMAIATAATFAAFTLTKPLDLLPSMWLWAACVTSMFLLSQFMLVNSVSGATVWLAGLVGLSQLVLSPAMRGLLQSIAVRPGLLVAVTLAAWGGFALWFLRTPALERPANVGVHGTRALKVNASHGTAVRVLLSGNPSGLSQFLSGLLCAGFILIAWGSLFAVLDRNMSFLDALLKAIAAALGLGAHAGIGGWLAARRSRSLWLRGGLDRMGLFRLCEAQAWKSFGEIGITTVVLLAIAWLLEPSIGARYTVLLAFHFCAGACLLYFGLMHVRGRRAVDVLCGAVLFLVWIMTYATTQIVLKTPWLLPVLIVAMLGAAFALRLVAMHRWRRIDWLVCKLPPPAARDEVRLAH
jgi:hypothetical protein